MLPMLLQLLLPMLQGTKINFLVGGGCNIGMDYLNPVTNHIRGGVYIELLVGV